MRQQDTVRKTVEAAVATALHAFGADAKAQARSVGAFIEGWLRAQEPYVLEGTPGQAFDIALVLPCPTQHGAGVFLGPVAGVARIASGRERGTLVAFDVPRLELGPNGRHAVRRIAAEAAAGYRRPEPVFDRTRRRQAAITARDVRTLGGAPDTREAFLNAGASRLRELLCELSHGVLTRPAAATVRAPAAGRVFHLTEEDGRPGALYFVSAEQELYRLLSSKPVPGISATEESPKAVRPGMVIARLPRDQVEAGAAKAVSEEIAPLAERVAQRRLAEAFSAFRARLDRRIMEAMRHAGSDEVATYNWLNASGAVDARLNRRQALEAYPLLVEGTLQSPGMTAAVDASQPLVEALAQALGAAPAAVRRLQGVRHGAIPQEGRLLACLPQIKDLPVDHLPSEGTAIPVTDQWEGLLCVWEGWSHALSKNFGRAPAVPGGVASRMAAEPPAWKRAGRLKGLRAQVRPAMDIPDFLDAFSRHVLVPVVVDCVPVPFENLPGGLLMDLPHLPDKDGRSLASEAVIRGRSLAALLEMSARWHDNLEEIEAEVALGARDPSQSCMWPPLSAPYGADLPSGRLDVIPLTRAAELIEEGRTQRHCVAGYTLRCLFSPVHIVSVRRGGEPLSTAEIRIREGGDGDPFELVQHRAGGNEDPCKEAEAALSAYLAALRGGALATDLPALKRALDARAEGRYGAALAETVGFDPRDGAARDHALRQYAFALPPEERGLGSRDWAGRLGLRDVLRGVIRNMPLDHTLASAVRDAVGGEAPTGMERREWARERLCAF